ncbi:hypothetical protein OIV83_004555 [Microbotryomycetes sp. JL201]|nr:hypothetical protein OIV83_004555 [Microbotryomycetes sp. JL201]
MANPITELVEGIWHIIQAIIRTVLGVFEGIVHTIEKLLVDTLKLSRDTARFFINNLFILLVFVVGFVVYSAVVQQKQSPAARAQTSAKKKL